MTTMKKKVTAVFLALVCAALCLTACDADKTKTEIPVALPDYSNSNLSYEFFGYTGPTDGTYSLDNIKYDVGEDFRTVERIKEYKESGMTMLMLRYENAYGGEDWATSNAKRYFEVGYAAGIEKIIVTDNRLSALIQNTSPVGENAQFQTQEAFESFVASCLNVYKDMPGFYGVVLLDEPTYLQIPAYGLVYRAIKKHLPETYIHCNLYPMGGELMARYGADGEYSSLTEAYTAYLENYIEATGAAEICFDSYPFKRKGQGLATGHYANLKIAAETAKKYGIELHSVAQTCSSFRNGQEFYRACEKSEMYSQLNSFMGFGVTDISYFTYFTKQDSFTDSHNFTDGGSFINRDGTKTNIYYDVKSIQSEMQAFANTILSYKYNAGAQYLNKPANFATAAHTADFVSDTLALIKDVTIDNDIALVTELRDEKNDKYMYMLQNIIDPGFAPEGRTSMNMTVSFDPAYNYAAVFSKGELSYCALSGGKYSAVISAGYAEFIVPLKG
jgi:hypothetical protein